MRCAAPRRRKREKKPRTSGTRTSILLDQIYTGKKFIFDRMTIADMAIFSQLHYLYTTVKYDIPAKYKNVNAFMENMRQTLKLKSLADSFEAQSL